MLTVALLVSVTTDNTDNCFVCCLFTFKGAFIIQLNPELITSLGLWSVAASTGGSIVALA